MRIHGPPSLRLDPSAETQPAPEAKPAALAPVASGYAPRWSLGRIVRRVATGALMALTVGTTTLTPAMASAYGAAPAGTTGAPLTTMQAEAQGPGQALLEAQAPLSSTRSALSRAKSQAYAQLSQGRGAVLRLEREVADLTELAALPDGDVKTVGAPSADPRLAIFEGLMDQGPTTKQKLAAAKVKLAEAKARLPHLESGARAADAAYDANAELLEALDAQALTLFEGLGLSDQALAALKAGTLHVLPGSLARGAGLLEIWAERHPDRALSTLTPAELSAFFVADRAGFEAELATLPAELFESPYDVMYAGSARAASPQSAARAQALAELGYRPMADDLVALGRLSEADFETFSGFVGELVNAGLEFQRHYASGGAFSAEVRGEARQLLDLLPWRDADARAGILEAARTLKADGMRVRPAEARLLSTLAEGGPSAARARALLDAATPPSDARDADYAVYVAKDPGRYGEPSQLRTRLEALGAKLGRKPTIAEAAQALEALAAGTALDALLPRTPGVQKLPIADWYGWRHAPEAYRADTKADLRGGLDARVKDPVLRLDSNTEYLEVSSEGFSKPELVKMHMLLDALEQPATRAHLLSELSGDLSDGARERGGLVRIESGKASFDMHASAHDDVHSATYSLPTDVEPLHALANFHFHAVRPTGERLRAGPSSVGRGQGADVGVTYLYQQDMVVVSALDVDAKGEVTSFNVDFVAKTGAVRDLGTFTR